MRSIWPKPTPAPRVFVATCPPVDEETRDRIRRHREARRGKDWKTVEVTVDLVDVLEKTPEYEVLLVDCLTLWINNLMYEAQQEGRQVHEDEVEARCGELLDVSTGRSGAVVFVTNEVGMGNCARTSDFPEVPGPGGGCNQVMAGRADRVVLMVAGIPMDLKRG